MPLFIFVSGYFAKTVNFKKIINLFLLLIIFQSIYKIIYLLSDMDFWWAYKIPYIQLWYLLSMIFWYLISLPLVKIKITKQTKYTILLFLLCIGVLSRFIPIDGYLLSYRRTLGFAFFFFLGFLIDKNELNKLRLFLKGRIKWIATAVFFLAVFIYLSIIDSSILDMIFHGSIGTEDLQMNFWPSVIYITNSYVISIVMCFAILTTVNNKKTYFTSWGDNSIYIFLFHMIFLIPLLCVPTLIEKIRNIFNKDILLMLLFIYSVAITMFLNSRIFIKYTTWLCNPYMATNIIVNKFKVKNKFRKVV
jgi:fucose 4-O-acetylase-like acetyltransferase